MEDILCALDTALGQLGQSGREALRRAGTYLQLLPDTRRRHVLSVEQLRSVCNALELEFHVGLPRLGPGRDHWRVLQWSIGRSWTSSSRPPAPLHGRGPREAASQFQGACAKSPQGGASPDAVSFSLKASGYGVAGQ